jgi:hypothetical protein
MQPTETPPWLIPLIVTGFFAMFAAIWLLVCFLIALASGWRGMVGRFSLPDATRGEPLASGRVNRVGMARFRGVLSFEAHPDGLIARVLWLFPFHPPLLIPWSAIAMRAAPGVFLSPGVFSAGELTVAQGPTFALNVEAFAAIERAMPRLTAPIAKASPDPTA